MEFCRFLPLICAVLHLFDLAACQNAAPSFHQCSSLNAAYVTGDCNTLIQIKEEVPIGTTLFILEANDADGDSVEFTITGDTNLIYFLKLTPDNANRRATVKANSRIDLESLSAQLATLKLRMNDFNGNTIDKDVLTFILNINDNAPQFQNLPYRWEIPENTLGTALTSFNVTLNDRDWATEIYNFSYSAGSVTDLLNESSKDTANLSPGTSYISTVTLLQPLDYESVRFYQITVFASEAGAEGSNATTDIVLTVTDQQDTAPIFQGIPYVRSMPENAAIGSLVTTIEAIDGDRGIPNAIRYVLDNTSAVASLFSLNSSDGRLLVAAEIDRESSLISSLFSSFSLTAIAEEVSGTSQPANISQTSVQIQVTITDVNDVTPTFNAAAYNATVLENSAAGVSITLLSDCRVTDTDLRDNGFFNISSMVNGSEYGVFTASPATGLNSVSVSLFVSNSSALDFETMKSFEFDLVASETKTSERLSSTAKVTVYLLDANDNTPMFNQSKFTFTIPENSPNGSFVGEVLATDADSGSFGSISYSIGGTGVQRFRINSSTGRIEVNVNADTDTALLNRETEPTIFLTLQARDGGGLTGSAQLEIRLEDKNDQTPVFRRSAYSGALKENSMSLEADVQLSAVDADAPPNNLITYSLLPSNESAHFSINNATGVLSVILAVDYESLTNKTMYFYAVATDGGSVPLSSSALVSIVVEDQNDVAPQCSQESYNASVAETDAAGTVVAQLAGSDGDSAGSENSQIFFRILNSENKFSMDSSGSKVTIERGADLDVTKFGFFYNLTMAVYDRGNPQLTSNCFLTVHVADVNNKAPSFDPLTSAASVWEGSSPSTPIITKAASDLDSSANLTYEIIFSAMTGRSAAGAAVASTAAYNFSTLLAIDENATIYVAGVLDREVAQELTIPILVRDLNAETASPVQTATGTVVLTLTDANNKPPKFIGAGPANNYSVLVSESITPRVDINLRPLAEDADSSTVSLTYAISPAHQFFEIDNTTAQVSLIKKLDFESQSQHVFHVTVNDSIHVTTATATVQVQNTNTYDPVFVAFPTNLNLVESTAVGTALTTVRATDNDTGVFGQIQYQLLTGQEFFNIDLNTGVITLGKALDRDVSGGSQQVLVVEAIDNPGGVDRKRISQRMVVNVLDVNDSPPTFPTSNFTFRNIRENYLTDHEIDEVQASDKDEGINSELTYDLEPIAGQSSVAMDLFKVETVTNTAGNVAKLRVNATLRGKSGWYNLTLSAMDAGVPTLIGRTNLTFFIAPVEDFSIFDDGLLGQFRTALIVTTLVLISICVVAFFLMARCYVRYRALMRIHGLDGAPVNNAASSGMNAAQNQNFAQNNSNTTGTKHNGKNSLHADSDSSGDSQVPAGRQSRPISAREPSVAPGLMIPDGAPTIGAHPFSSSQTLPPLDQATVPPASASAGNPEPLFPRSFTLLKTGMSSNTTGV